MEWLKTILGNAYTDEIGKKAAEEIGKTYIAKTEYDALTASKTAVDTQLADANKAIEGFKGKDPDAIQKEADDWKAKYEAEQKASAEKLAAVQFNAALDTATLAAKGRNAKAIRALMDDDTLGKLQSSKNQAEDIKQVLEAIKKDNGYLFEEAADPKAPPYAGGTGTVKVDTPPADSLGAAIAARMGLSE